MPTPCYCTAPDGTVYRVYDILRRDGEVAKYANPPAAWANARLFRPADGWWRIWPFFRPEDREPTEEALAWQLRQAGYFRAPVPQPLPRWRLNGLREQAQGAE